MQKLASLKYQSFINSRHFSLALVFIATFNIDSTKRRVILTILRTFMMVHLTRNCPGMEDFYHSLITFPFSWTVIVFPYSNPLKFPYGHCICWLTSSITVFFYQDDDPKGPIRTSRNVKEDGIEAARHQKQGMDRYFVNGVKGPSWLSLLKHFDLVRGSGSDYMHGVLLGVQKLLLTSKFNPTFSKEHFTV